MKPIVSVTTTTKNEEANIERCLQSIALQDMPVHIIVVDNGSTDGTKRIARKYTRSVFNKGPERSAQRNFGMIQKSAAPYVMFIDADMILSSGVIRACVRTIERTGADALHIPETVLGRKYFSAVRRFERSFYDGTVIDGARFFRRKAFIAAGGFDETMSGPEDWDIDKKIKQNGRIALVKREEDALPNAPWERLFGDYIRERGVAVDRAGTCIFHNEAEFDLSRYVSKKTYYIGSFDTYLRKWGTQDADVRKQLGMYRLLGVFIEKGKWLRLLRHPLLTAGMYLLRTLIGVRYVFRPRVRK